MRIIVKAKTKAKIVEVKRVGHPIMNFGNIEAKPELAVYKVSVKEAPINGKANEAIIEALAEYFDTAKSNINLISGQSSKQKIFEIN